MDKAIFTLAADQQLILASTSPRRRQLLETLGVPFTLFSPSIDEPTPQKDASPADFALDCACLKNDECRRALRDPAAVVSCDTIVAIDNIILGKPENPQEALEMLARLNGREHTVFSCFCLALVSGMRVTAQCEAQVKFHLWSEKVLASYAASGESLDKAGAYAIQGKGAFLTESIRGSWTTVVGLPMAELTAALLEHGVIIPVAAAE